MACLESEDGRDRGEEVAPKRIPLCGTFPCRIRSLRSMPSEIYTMIDATYVE